MEQNLSHSSEEEETDFAIEEIHDEKTVAYALYYKLIAYENHYNVIQMRYKQLAVTWVLATFIGIGYLLSGFEASLPIDPKLAVMFLCLFAAEGIFLIWFLDVNVYYKLIESIFGETIKFESQHDFIVKTHNNIINSHNIESEPHKFHGYFYLTFIGFFLIIASVSLVLHLYTINPTIAFVVAGLLFTFMVVFSITNKKIAYFFTNLKK